MTERETLEKFLVWVFLSEQYYRNGPTNTNFEKMLKDP